MKRIRCPDCGGRDVRVLPRKEWSSTARPRLFCRRCGHIGDRDRFVVEGVTDLEGGDRTV